MNTAAPKEATRNDVKQDSIAEIVSRRQVTRVQVTRKSITRQDVLEDAFTYQIPMEVTQVLKRLNGDCYPVCPRCKMTIEREYMGFCDRCGQKLGWAKLKNAIYVYPGYYSTAKKTHSVTFLYFKYIYPVKQARGQGLGKDSIRKTHSRGAKQEGIYTAGSGK